MNRTGERHRSVRITVVLACAIGALVFVSAGLVLALSARTAIRNTLELLHQAAETTINTVEREVDAHLRPVEHSVRHIAELVADGTLEPSRADSLFSAFRGALAAAPQVSGMVYWDMQGTAHSVLRDAEGAIGPLRHEPTDNEEILGLLASDLTRIDLRWRRPAREQGATYVNVVAPLIRDGKPLGLIAAGLAVARLSQFVDKAGSQFGMTAFILYGNGHVLAHPHLDNGVAVIDETDSALMPLAELDDGVLRQFFDVEPVERERRHGLLLREIDWQGDDYVLLSRPTWSYGQTAWHIGVYAPLSRFDDQVKRLVLSIVAALVVLALALIAAVVLARYVARPIRATALAAERIGKLDLAEVDRLPRSRIRELDDQAAAFNRMLDGLKWFETYVPKRLVRRLIAGNADRAVASEEREVTVMFTDIIGFTALTETMKPAEVGAMLNEHFAILGRCIEAEGGTLDKYIGDAVMAFWGAPEHQPDHAARACRTALAIAQALAEASDVHPAHPALRIKVAIHTGRMLVGNIGAPSRMNYTVIGDTVNACSRIELLCADQDDGAPAVILASEDTVAAASDAGLEFAPVGDFKVKGRRETVTVSRLIVP